MFYIKFSIKKIYHILFIHHIITYICAAFSTLPYKSNYMELKYGLWIGLSSLHSIDGRQFGENNTEPKIFRDKSICTQLHECKFEGARFGFLMNMTSLKIVMREWDSALNIIISIRQLYLDRMNQPNKTLTLYECYLVSKMCVALPAYLIRKSKPIIKNGKIPIDISAQYQLISGVFMIVRKMIEESESFLSKNATLSAEDIYEYADMHKMFFSNKNNQVCAGSKVKIIELIECVLNGKKSIETHKPDYIHSTIVDTAIFFKYAMASIEIELIIALSRSSSQRVFLSLFKSTDINTLNAECSNVLDNVSGLDYSKSNFSDNLSNKISSYIDILTECIQCRDDTVVLNIANLSVNNDTLKKYDASSLKKYFEFYKGILNITEKYLLNQQKLINKYLEDNRELKVNAKEISLLISVIPEKYMVNI